MKEMLIKEPPDNIIEAVKKVFVCQAKERAIKELLTPKLDSLIESLGYKCPKMGKITKDKRAWLLSDDDYKQYSKERGKLLYNNGFTDGKYQNGYCPILEAENETRKAKNELIKLLEPITDIKHCDLIRNLKHYNNYIELNLNYYSQFINV